MALELADDIETILNRPEDEEGNVEYKRLIDSETNLEKRANQMQRRMRQGDGECIYMIGLDDDGSFHGLDEEETFLSLSMLEKVAEMNDYSIRVIDTLVKNGKTMTRVLVRENNLTFHREIHIATAGSPDAGKSTLIGVLSSGKLDNGRGSARSRVFNFKHELDSGRTSSMSMTIIGYNTAGEHVKQEGSIRELTMDEIADRSAKVVNVSDLAGHARYTFRTTYSGLASRALDFALIIIGANRELTSRDMVLEHIKMCISYRLPIVFVMTKMDMVADKMSVYDDTLTSIRKLFKKGSSTKLYRVKNISDVVEATQMKEKHIVPLFEVSSTTGQGIQLLHEFLNLYQSNNNFSPLLPVELYINANYLVKGVGTVVSGFLAQGTVKRGETYFLGPYINGSYRPVTVKGIHVKRKNVELATAGRNVCLALKNVDRNEIKRGMVILSIQPKPIKSFKAEVIADTRKILHSGYKPIMIAEQYRSAVEVLKVDYEVDVPIRKSNGGTKCKGSRTCAIFKPVYRQPHLKIGDRFVLVDGGVRLVGIVTELYST
jgi:elongation factor 1-alpha